MKSYFSILNSQFSIPAEAGNEATAYPTRQHPTPARQPRADPRVLRRAAEVGGEASARNDRAPGLDLVQHRRGYGAALLYRGADRGSLGPPLLYGGGQPGGCARAADAGRLQAMGS